MNKSTAQRKTVAVTGVTGYLGGEIVARLLERDNRSILCFVRAPTTDGAKVRGRDSVEAALGRCLTPEEVSRLRFVPGNIETQYFGLAPTVHDSMASDVEEIYHCAASTRLDQPLREARVSNVRGVHTVHAFAVEAAARGDFRRLHHVSSAFVVGRRKGRIEADRLPADGKGARYRNSYEQSKAEAELWLQGRALVPTTVYRPTVIVGDSRTGRTTSRTAVHYVMNLMTSGWLRFAPGTLKSRLDCVPGDFVADAILALGARADSAGGVYQISSGTQSLSLHQLIACTREGLRRCGVPTSAWRTQVLAPLPWWIVSLVRKVFLAGRRKRAMQKYRRCEPYTRLECLFDNSREARLLTEAGIDLPAPESFFPHTVDYAVRHDFVRKVSCRDSRERAALSMEARAFA